MTTYRALYARAKELLPSAFEAEQLLLAVTGLRWRDLPLRGEGNVPPALAERLLGLCARRQSGEPLQYLLGAWEFYGLPFAVGPGVLIPRPDTEALVDCALELLGNKPSPRVLDLCSGSGCIAVALAKHLPGADITAVELSAEALAYLYRNVETNGAAVRVVQEDAYTYTHPYPLDLIASNPPYIPSEELSTLQREVRREPRMALDGGTDGLDFYRLLAARYVSQLAPGGILLAEVGFGQSGEVSALLEHAGLRVLAVRRDLGGVERVVVAQKEINGPR